MTNKELNKEISSLRIRITSLVDEVKILKSELKRFKTDVASDVKYLTDNLPSQ